MKLERNFVGQINLNGGTVDVTDPCYNNRGQWTRTTLDVKPGNYNCYSYIGVSKAWGQRVWVNQIVIADGEDAAIAEEKIKNGKSWRKVATIGVDAGLAGYFDNKPDFDDDMWDDFCHWMWNKEENHNSEGADDSYIRKFSGKDGFWTESGAGDGCYEVFAIRNNSEIVALEIRF